MRDFTHFVPMSGLISPTFLHDKKESAESLKDPQAGVEPATKRHISCGQYMYLFALSAELLEVTI